MSESPIERAITDRLPADGSAEEESVGALIDYNHEPPQPVVRLDDCDEAED